MLAAVPLTAASNLVAKVISAYEKPEVVVFWQSALAVVFFAPLALWARSSSSTRASPCRTCRSS